ncbi:helix-turn-helix domain-containing protein [Litchfieldia alkalitelluris]|uniref:helix-turn-helix domain-containing protein n=1 Tax=Litchfieldia alkalitelluris TaxID=304268 RepID=UPI0038B2ACAA
MKKGQTVFKKERVIDVFGLGKKRSKFGKWLDREGLTQSEVAKKAKISNQTISRYCSGEDEPKISTWVKIHRALKSMGYDKDYTDFF